MLSFFQDDDPAKIRRSLFLLLTISIALSKSNEEGGVLQAIFWREEAYRAVTSSEVFWWIVVAIFYLGVRHILNAVAGYKAFKSEDQPTFEADVKAINEYAENQKTIIRKLEKLEEVRDYLPAEVESLIKKLDYQTNRFQRVLDTFEQRYEEYGFDDENTQRALAENRDYLDRITSGLYNQMRDILESQSLEGFISNIRDQIDEYATHSSELRLKDVRNAADDRVASAKLLMQDRFGFANLALGAYTLFALVVGVRNF